MADYDREVYKMRENEKLSYKQIAERMGITEKQVNHALYRIRKEKNFPPPDEIDLKTECYNRLVKGVTRDSLKDKFKISTRVINAIINDLQEEGVLIDESDTGILSLRKTIVPKWDNAHTAPFIKGTKIIRFGLCGDKQFNSKFTQITHMHTLYDFYEKEGITTVYDTGDLDEGEKMRQGHQYECYNQGADDHTDEIVKNHPYRKGIKTYFITGNHDHSLIKLAGFDIGTAVASRRDDMIYLGQSYAQINLTDNCILELRHPIDATAYAWSYKIQKMVEALPGGEKPNILAIGHYHKMEQLFYRNIHALQTGCLQSQTAWMRGKGIAAIMGGWIVELEVDTKGEILRIKTEFKPFYQAIKDDYKNWR